MNHCRTSRRRAIGPPPACVRRLARRTRPRASAARVDPSPPPRPRCAACAALWNAAGQVSAEPPAHLQPCQRHLHLRCPAKETHASELHLPISVLGGFNLPSARVTPRGNVAAERRDKDHDVGIRSEGATWPVHARWPSPCLLVDWPTRFTTVDPHRPASTSPPSTRALTSSPVGLYERLSKRSAKTTSRRRSTRRRVQPRWACVTRRWLCASIVSICERPV